MTDHNWFSVFFAIAVAVFHSQVIQKGGGGVFLETTSFCAAPFSLACSSAPFSCAVGTLPSSDSDRICRDGVEWDASAEQAVLNLYSVTGLWPSTEENHTACWHGIDQLRFLLRLRSCQPCT